MASDSFWTNLDHFIRFWATNVRFLSHLYWLGDVDLNSNRNLVKKGQNIARFHADATVRAGLWGHQDIWGTMDIDIASHSISLA